MTPPLITTLVITYNQAPYLDTLLHSLLNQTYTNQNLIISDDASNDGSQEILLKSLPDLKDRYRKVDLYLQKENLGLSGRNNISFVSSLIETKYCQILEGDDYYYLNKTELCLDVLENIDCGLVHGNFTLLREGSAKFNNGWAHFGVPYMPDSRDGPMYNHLINRNLVLTCTAAFNSSLYKQAYDYTLFTKHGILLGDYAGTIRMSRLANFRYINQEIAYYRSLSTSTVNNPKTRPQIVEDTYRLQELARSNVI